MKVKIYIEGGGDAKSLHIKCREAFRKLLERAGFRDRMPALKACGSRSATFDDFKTAMDLAGPSNYPILLVDSEAPVDEACDSWTHLRRRDQWTKPKRAKKDQAQLMVQCMEAWCVADRAALRRFFGQGFRENALPPEKDLELRAKHDVQEALANATRECGRDRAYRKGKRSFELVADLDPTLLQQHLPHFRRLLDSLNRLL